MSSSAPRRRSRIRLATLAVLAVGALATAAIMLAATDGAADGGIGWLLGFLLWALLPYPLLALGTARLRRHGLQWVVLAGSVLLTAAALLIYALAVWGEPDAQGALVFVFIPLYQLGAAILMLPLRLLDRRPDAPPPAR